jgi:trans-2,3-dihydro-3-hydroxyanthranilate isomerase
MRYRYYTCDVFTERRFGGNPLAVLPEAMGLSSEQMQRIAREFNYSETTFVLPADDPAHTRKVRIFTPGAEIPFAGHPNVGTAFVLAAIGTLAAGKATLQVVFEEGAGSVPVTIRYQDDQPVYCELTAPQALTLGAMPPVGAVAASLGLSPDTVVTSTHSPRVASAGLPFLLVELRDRTALAEARVRQDEHAALMHQCGGEGLHLYTRDTGVPGVDLRARMYAPLHGVAEDPATGSANVALAGLLAACAPEADGTFAWRIAQGVEMGRPSLLEASAIKRGGEVETVRIGGRSVLVCDGWIEVGDAPGYAHHRAGGPAPARFPHRRATRAEGRPSLGHDFGPPARDQPLRACSPP